MTERYNTFLTWMGMFFFYVLSLLYLSFLFPLYILIHSIIVLLLNWCQVPVLPSRVCDRHTSFFHVSPPGMVCPSSTGMKRNTFK